MKLTSSAFSDGSAIPAEFAFCAADAVRHVVLSTNRNPPLVWQDAPANTKSFTLICHDPDVPIQGDKANQEGQSVPAALPRRDFFHWVLVDLPASRTAIAAGEFSSRLVIKGKLGPAAMGGTRQGLNDYTDWFANNKDMRGDYYGYDGPCPPWNDEIAHRYVFTLYAIDVPRLPVEGAFTGNQIRQVIQGHVLAQATLTGLYTLNPAVKI